MRTWEDVCDLDDSPDKPVVLVIGVLVGRALLVYELGCDVSLVNDELRETSPWVGGILLKQRLEFLMTYL